MNLLIFDTFFYAPYQARMQLTKTWPNTSSPSSQSLEFHIAPFAMNYSVNVLLVVLVTAQIAYGFVPYRFGARTAVRGLSAIDQVGKVVELEVPMDGENVKAVPISLRPIFANSEFFVVTYDVPFGLNVDKPPKNFPAPIVTKDGKNGEKVGDVLRATSAWSQGFNAAGVTSDIVSFAGNIKWRRSVFDTTGAPWEQVVQALTSNTAERCSQVSLVFEREVDEVPGAAPSAEDADEA